MLSLFSIPHSSVCCCPCFLFFVGASSCCCPCFPKSSLTQVALVLFCFRFFPLPVLVFSSFRYCLLLSLFSVLCGSVCCCPCFLFFAVAVCCCPYFLFFAVAVCRCPYFLFFEAAFDTVLIFFEVAFVAVLTFSSLLSLYSLLRGSFCCCPRFLFFTVATSMSSRVHGRCGSLIILSPRGVAAPHG